MRLYAFDVQQHDDGDQLDLVGSVDSGWEAEGDRGTGEG